MPRSFRGHIQACSKYVSKKKCMEPLYIHQNRDSLTTRLSVAESFISVTISTYMGCGAKCVRVMRYNIVKVFTR